jgi:hypothetical protein
MATPNIELQTVQQPLVQDAKVFDRNSIWYTNRPISTRTQTDNRYLDWVIWLDTKTIPDLSETLIDGYSFSTTGKYNFDWANGKIIIPINWTYMVQVAIDWNVVDPWDYQVRLYKNWAMIVVNMRNYVWVANEWYEDMNRVYNLNKWDYFEVKAFQDSWSGVDIDISVTVIKI